MIKLIEWIGKVAISLFENLGSFTLVLFDTFYYLFHRDWRLKQLFLFMEEVGVNSIFVVTVTSTFTGVVLAVQTLDQFVRFGATEYIGGVIGLSMIREMGPVLTGILVAGRVGSAMAAEIGTMKVTEQIDAIKSFGVNPRSYIAVPRVLASFIMLPVLTIYADALGILGGLIFVNVRGISFFIYKKSLEVMIEPFDIWCSLSKAAVFGLIIGIVACAKGFNTEGGARGVGKTTTSSVVWSNMLILVANYFLSTILYGK